MMRRSVQVSSINGVAVATLPPEIGEGDVDALRLALFTVLAKAPPRLVVDLSRTLLCCASGIQALVGAERRARHIRTHLSLAIPGPRLQALVEEVAGKSAVEPVVCPTLAAALADRQIRPWPWSEDKPLAPTGYDLALGEDLAVVTGLYLDEDTAASCWLALRSSNAHRGGEQLVPVHSLEDSRRPGRLATRVAAQVVRSAPTLHAAPDRLCDCDEDPAWRHYARGLSPVAGSWPRPTTCSARRCVRASDPVTVLGSRWPRG